MFESRFQAGELLAQKLLGYKNRPDVVLLAIPRGGVPVAKIISTRLGLPVDLIITKKIPAPKQEELAIGAVGPEGNYITDRVLVKQLGLSHEDIDGARRKAEEKRFTYEQEFKTRKLNFKDKVAILVDDGAATGATIEVAIGYLKSKKAKEIVVAIPVAPVEVVKRFESLVDKVVALETPLDFRAVGQFYKNFPQVTNAEVVQLLRE